MTIPTQHHPHKPHLNPLLLKDLQPWVTTETYAWVEQGDAQAAALQDELEQAGTHQIQNLFSNNDSENDDSDNASNHSDADYEGLYDRVRVWTSSKSNKDGWGSRYSPDNDIDNNDNDNNDCNISIPYVISESWKGYGDLLWASSRHLANQLANPDACRRLLEPLLSSSDKEESLSSSTHPLHNISVLELGAGCGVPSLMAWRCGAHPVVVTDLDDPNRIRSLAEALARNQHVQHVQNGQARAAPFCWGQDPTALLKCLKDLSTTSTTTNSEPRFDVICATDCLFMPWLHEALLTSLDQLLADQGVILLCFCIHADFSAAEQVWPFVDKARNVGFQVETLEAVQLTPPKIGMYPEQGLVNTLRLVRRPTTQQATTEKS